MGASGSRAQERPRAGSGGAGPDRSTKLKKQVIGLRRGGVKQSARLGKRRTPERGKTLG